MLSKPIQAQRELWPQNCLPTGQTAQGGSRNRRRSQSPLCPWLAAIPEVQDWILETRHRRYAKNDASLIRPEEPRRRPCVERGHRCVSPHQAPTIASGHRPRYFRVAMERVPYIGRRHDCSTYYSRKKRGGEEVARHPQKVCEWKAIFSNAHTKWLRVSPTDL